MSHAAPDLSPIILKDVGQPSRMFLDLVKALKDRQGVRCGDTPSESFSTWIAQNRAVITVLQDSISDPRVYAEMHSEVTNTLWLLDGQLDVMEAMLIFADVWA